jgi:hypothetical protein
MKVIQYASNLIFDKNNLLVNCGLINYLILAKSSVEVFN